MNQNHRWRRHRRQNLMFFCLALIIGGVHTWLLLFNGIDLPQRRKRKPVAVALVSTQLNKRPPTPAIIAQPEPTKEATVAAAVPKPPPAEELAKPKEAVAKKKSKQGKNALKKKKKVVDAGVAAPDAATAGSPVDAAVADSAPTAAPKQRAVAAGGRRRCSFDGPGAAYEVRRSTGKKSQSYPISLLAPFRTRPSLASYVPQAELLGRLGSRARPAYRIALPEDVIRFELTEPRGASIYVGRTDARCVITGSVTGPPLLVKLRSVPVRLVDKAKRVASAIVDITIDENATLQLRFREGDKLPFTRAKLANHRAVSATMKGHLELARRNR